ncbi:MAG TPA: squalene/phytoene synthase family protein [Polyangiaceae bacterium]|jgi:farnesyl-diphosphate farnesyltransferase|nr:squalene/phytoene synthase family protein [Polyangiaceae bacterium]
MVVKPGMEADWAYCEQALLDVSRTFSKPIELLPEPLKVALTLGYLLCRAVDTVEDYAPLTGAERDELFSTFIAVLDNAVPAEKFSQAFASAQDDNAEIRLARSLPRVMRVFDSQEAATRRATVAWVTEMANGMRLYCRRDRQGALTALGTFSDLERYCYFVAGTVGHLITDLFAEHMQATASPLEHKLRARAESFGIGLQMVNILKDVTEDYARNRCYVPRELCHAQGFAPERLLNAEHRRAAHRALACMFESAGRHLDDALEYTLLIPAKEVQLRLFCLLPLWMAQRTLLVAVGNDAVLTPDKPVKITREAVDDIIEDCLRHANDDAALRRRYGTVSAEFKERLATLIPASRPRAASAEGYARI